MKRAAGHAEFTRNAPGFLAEASELDLNRLSGRIPPVE
jgi:hypothetical protein